MKNTIKVLGIIAFVAIIGFSMTSCQEEIDEPLPTTNNINEQTAITVTGIPTQYNSKYAFGGISKTGYETGIAMPKQISGGSVKLLMINEKEDMVSVSGYWTILLIITETRDPNSTTHYKGYVFDTVDKGNNTIAFSEFDEVK